MLDYDRIYFIVEVDNMNMFIEYSSTWAIVILILIFIIYVVQAIFLSKFNK